ncbi:MAG: hypothetical protein M3Y07_07035 [Acidobacteriota bacterium]|nr:hypothetical protein [Acidobacteriota bacterium]
MRSYFGVALCTAVLGAAFLAPRFSIAADRDDHRAQRYYDGEARDYHEWNEGEDRAYREFLRENHREYREFRKMNRREQREYWKWRHQHMDADRH